MQEVTIDTNAVTMVKLQVPTQIQFRSSRSTSLRSEASRSDGFYSSVTPSFWYIFVKTFSSIVHVNIIPWMCHCIALLEM